MKFKTHFNLFRAQNAGQNPHNAIAIIISIQGEGGLLL